MKLIDMVGAIVLGMILGGSGQSYASTDFLITLEDGKPVAQLAKSWRKLADNKYEFTLDQSKEVGRNRPVQATYVKSSLEARLGQSLGVSVNEKSEAVVEVSFRGDEREFLKQVAQTRIRARRNVELALESSVSSGGFRANKVARAPSNGEVKASVVTIDKGVMTVFVYQVGQEGVPASIRTSRQLKIRIPERAELSQLKRDDDVFFKPVRLKDGVWQVKSVSLD